MESAGIGIPLLPHRATLNQGYSFIKAALSDFIETAAGN
jgi:hypothetical protein